MEALTVAPMAIRCIFSPRQGPVLEGASERLCSPVQQISSKKQQKERIDVENIERYKIHTNVNIHCTFAVLRHPNSKQID